MITVPADWLQAASGTHAPRWRARLLTAAGDITVDDLPVVGGQIVRDETRNPRTEVNVDVPTTAIPGLLDQAYLPTGGRLQLQWTLQGSGTWVTMADVDVVAAAISRPEDMWTIAGADRSARIALDDLSRSTIADYGGQTYAAAITALVQRTFPGTTVTATGPATTLIVPNKYGGNTVDGSAWRLAEELVAEAQSEVFYDTARRVVIRPIPGTGTPVDALGTGPAGNLTGYTINHQLAHNSVALVYVNNTSGNVMRRGRWLDTRTTSPVSVQRIGSQVVLGSVINADDAPSQATADAAAAALGARAGGRAREAELRHPTRPWLEPGDTVEVTYLGGPTESQVIRSVGIDLGPANIQVTRLRNSDYQMGVPV